MEITATKFRQKTCPKCNTNHDNNGVLCGFCIEKEQRRKERQQVYPENFMVECLVEREGDTAVIVGGMKYTFRRNDAGHSVCDVVNHGHYKMFTERMGKLYRAYRPEEDYPQAVDKNLEPDDEDWPLGDAPQPVVTIKESDHDSAGAGDGQAVTDAGGISAGDDRTGSGKQRSKRDRAGTGAAEVGSGPGGDQPELCPGNGQQDPA